MSNLENIENLTQLSDRMSLNYNKLQMLMAELYRQLQEGQNVTDSMELLKYLGEIGMSMLDTQRDFVEVYGKYDPSIQMQLLNQIDGKMHTLHESNAQLKENNIK